MFQYQLGSIGATWTVRRIAAQYTSFNTSLVRLAPLIAPTPRCSDSGFNTSLVRLAPQPTGGNLGARHLFQYQLGSIGAWKHQLSTTSSPSFQYQLGSIGAGEGGSAVRHHRHVSIPAWFDWRRRLIASQSHDPPRFNTSLVRLAPMGPVAGP